MPEPIRVLNAIGGTWREAASTRRLDDVGPTDGAVIACIGDVSALLICNDNSSGRL